MNERPDPLVELLAAAGCELEPCGEGWRATHRATGLVVEARTPAEAARRILALLKWAGPHAKGEK